MMRSTYSAVITEIRTLIVLKEHFTEDELDAINWFIGGIGQHSNLVVRGASKDNNRQGTDLRNSWLILNVNDIAAAEQYINEKLSGLLECYKDDINYIKWSLVTHKISNCILEVNGETVPDEDDSYGNSIKGGLFEDCTRNEE